MILAYTLTVIRKPINSHLVAEKILKLIAEDSSVLTWDLRNDTLVKRLKANTLLDQFFFEPTSVGIGQKSKVTFPLFCDNHDGPIFAPLERDNLSHQLSPEQMSLLAYRALCASTFDQLLPERTFAISEKHGTRSSYNTDENLPRLNRFLSRDVMLTARQRYEDILETNDFQQIEGITYLTDHPPCIASTFALIPSDKLDAMLTVTSHQVLTAEDVVIVSFFPNPPSNSIFIISWLKGSKRTRVLLNTIINPVPLEKKHDYFLRFGLRAPNVYVSPKWWKELSLSQKESCIEEHLTAQREFSKLV